MFKQFLSQIYRIYKAEIPIPLERYVINFIFDVPLPPRGDTRVQYTLADSTMFISRPEPNQLPLLNISMKPLFQALCLKNIVALIGYLLCERSVVLLEAHRPADNICRITENIIVSVKLASDLHSSVTTLYNRIFI